MAVVACARGLVFDKAEFTRMFHRRILQSLMAPHIIKRSQPSCFLNPQLTARALQRKHPIAPLGKHRNSIRPPFAPFCPRALTLKSSPLTPSTAPLHRRRFLFTLRMWREGRRQSRESKSLAQGDKPRCCPAADPESTKQNTGTGNTSLKVKT